jgi:hypothetical protein
MRALNHRANEVELVTSQRFAGMADLLLGLLCLGTWAVVWVTFLYPIAVGALR